MLITYKRTGPDALDPLTCLQLLADGSVGVAEVQKTLRAFARVDTTRPTNCLVTLQEGTSAFVGGMIEVTALSARGGKSRIGILSPREFRITKTQPTPLELVHAASPAENECMDVLNGDGLSEHDAGGRA